MRCIQIKQSENLRARPIALETGLALECPVAQHYLVTTRNAAGPTAHPEKRAARLSPLGGTENSETFVHSGQPSRPLIEPTSIDVLAAIDQTGRRSH